MIKLYVLQTSSLDDPRDHEEWKSQLPAGRWEKPVQLASLQDRKNAAGAGWLLCYVFRQEDILLQPDPFFHQKDSTTRPDPLSNQKDSLLQSDSFSNQEDSIPRSDPFFYGKYGKPYHEALQFNLSHSGDIVICVTGQTEIGCDIQKICPCRDRMVRRFFSPAEQEYIFSGEGDEKDERFIRLWTRKESYLKKTGAGLTQDLRHLSFLSGAGFYECRLPGYVICICSDELLSGQDVECRRIDKRCYLDGRG
ncbi:MAG: 4'-phosphopantetheinyl transferase superfamily protein [Clostridiales bacterium]|nr:4'-phosphopantetheinyl transferase superfamily protein [Clostridiales bacterium]